VKRSLRRFPNLVCGPAWQANVWAPLRWKRAKIHRGSRRRILEAASRSRIYVSSCDCCTRSSQSVAIGRGPYTSTHGTSRHSLRCGHSDTIGGKADIGRSHRLRWPDAIDPGCVKTHTSAKCGKHNSPARHQTSRVQYDLTLRYAIPSRSFYARSKAWSFYTAKTRSGH
jgi:hypothetical protein